jgi:threonine dehydrogenase-like Zn-dependent dehydrogenase
MSDTVIAIMEATRAAAKKGILSMWTVYDGPKDHPTSYVVRRFDCTATGPVATADAWTGSLELIRESLYQAGLIRMQRHPDDEPQIVETWL